MKIKTTKEVKQDLTTIKKYLNTNYGIPVADNIMYAIEKSVLLIGNNPYIGVGGRLDNTREFFIPRLQIL